MMEDEGGERGAESCYRIHVHVRGQFCVVSFFPSTFIWFLGVELGSPALRNKHLYPMNRLAPAPY